MHASRRVPTLILAASLVMATGCTVEDDSAPEDSPESGIVEEVESPVHGIRVAEGYWSGMPMTAEVFLAPDNREGWTFAWRVGGGTLSGSGREVTWTTPLADSCWIESTIQRAGLAYLSRRWIPLRNDTLTFHLEQVDDVPSIGDVRVEAVCNRPFPEGASIVWGEDAGADLAGSPTLKHWAVCARGPHRIWAVATLGEYVAADELVVVVPNAAPELVTGGNWEGPSPLGSEVQDLIRAGDANRDSLHLELLDLDGLELVDSTWIVHGHESDFLGHWSLTLRHTDGLPGQREVRFRVGDGLAWTPGNLWFSFQ
jgi:hypothetical protein